MISCDDLLFNIFVFKIIWNQIYSNYASPLNIRKSVIPDYLLVHFVSFDPDIEIIYLLKSC